MAPTHHRSMSPTPVSPIPYSSLSSPLDESERDMEWEREEVKGEREKENPCVHTPLPVAQSTL